ncbi:MAG: peroxiredoxin [Ignavibacteria bacterium RBG_13_36_8]|nr:MAG: peroxiredoxin [Ignavibacteria bacterium RBG_13_36_8]
MSLKIGDVAPEFTLKNHNLEDVSLSTFKGKTNVVILFFPLVNSPACEKELCSIRDGLSQYSDLDAQILAISVDSPFAQKLWMSKNQFNFPLLSDFNKEVCQKYGAYYDVFVPGKFDYKGVAKRSAFVVDKGGIIRYVEVLEKAGDEPNYDAIKQALKNIS